MLLTKFVILSFQSSTSRREDRDLDRVSLVRLTRVEDESIHFVRRRIRAKRQEMRGFRVRTLLTRDLKS